MSKIKTNLMLFFVLMLCGCQKVALLNPKGLIAAQEKAVLIWAVILMCIVVIPVIGLSIFVPWRYRAKNSKSKYTPEWGHSYLLEIVWWSIPIIIIGILATGTWVATHRLDPYRPLYGKGKPIIIQAMALNWKWLFIYPDQGIATLNYLQIPVNKPIRFLLTSDGPMNSLAIPQLAGQIYAMAGMRTKLNIIANHIGSYTGRSTNISGRGFDAMHFKTDVVTTQRFNAWVTHERAIAPPLTKIRFEKLRKPSTNQPEIFASPSKGLFKGLIMDFMKPGGTLSSFNEEPKVSTK